MGYVAQYPRWQKPRHRWEDNIKLHSLQIGCECGLDHLVHVGTSEHSNKPSGSLVGRELFEKLSSSQLLKTFSPPLCLCQLILLCDRNAIP
jgi:hypothetical protein